MSNTGKTSGAQDLSGMSYEDQIRILKQQLSDAQAAKRETAKAKGPKRTPRPCGCGCGAITGGGTFVPGHDAKLRSALLARIRQGGADGEAALAELRKHPALAHGVGEEQLGRDAKEAAEKAARKAEREQAQLERLRAKLAAAQQG